MSRKLAVLMRMLNAKASTLTFGSCSVFTSLRFSALLVFVLCMSVRSLSAQSTTAYDQPTSIGIEPFGTYTTGLDQIDLGDLNLHIDIPLFVHNTQRGGDRGVSVHLIYDSSYLDSEMTPNDWPWPLNSVIANVGWRIQAGGSQYGSMNIESVSEGNCERGQTGCTPLFDSMVQFNDSTGYTHSFGPWTSTGHLPTSVTQQAIDGSGYLLTLNYPSSPSSDTVVIKSPSGESFTSGPGTANTAVDPNGNVTPAAPVITINNYYGLSNSLIASNGSEFAPQTISDASGVSVTLSGGGYAPTYNYANPADPTSRNPVYITYTDTNGNSQTIVITYKLYTILPEDFQANAPSDPAFMLSMNYRYLTGLVDTITYPDGSTYRFTYQTSSYLGVPGGQLASITLPTGGAITYQTAWSSLSCPYMGLGNAYKGYPSQMIRTSPDGETTYERTIQSFWPSLSASPGCQAPAASTTQVSHADGSSETINFVGIPEDIPSVPIDGGSGFDNFHNIETAHSYYSVGRALMKSTMKCYNGSTGQCTTTSFSLPITEIATTTTLDSGQTSEAVNWMNSAGLTTEVDEYDYGATSPTRKTVTQYAPLGNNIQDRPSSVTVYNASGVQASRTTYGYDEYSLSSTSGLPEHVAVSGSRGNMTSKHVWLNTTGGTTDTHQEYDDAGQVAAAEDANGNWTQYAYDAAMDSCLTKTTPPTPSSGVSNATSQTCDPNTGLVTSKTDPDGVVTSYSFNLMLRPSGTTVIAPGGTVVAQKAISYSGASLPETITTTVVASPSPNQISTVSLDGLGRIVNATAPSGAKTVTTYNSMGYVQSVSNPFLTTGDSTYGITSYSYDGLGRKIDQCQPDNSGTPSTTCSPSASYQSWSYNGNCLTFRDEDSNQSKQCTDALGRLTEVFEPNGSTQSPSMETDYTYDAQDNLLRVDQWGGAKGASGERVRTFTYDSLSRIITSSNPEAGTVCYGVWSGSSCVDGYDANGNLLNKTDARGMTTSYVYDALNRMTQKQVFNSFAYSYFYDAYPGVCSGQGNTIGRLCYTTNNVNAGKKYGYDPMGRLQQEFYCTPQNCSYANSVQGKYDLAGDLISLTYPDGRTVSRTFDSAGRLADVTDPWIVTVANPGGNYLSGLGYDASGHVTTESIGAGLASLAGSNNNREEVASLAYSMGSATKWSKQYVWQPNGNLDHAVDQVEGTTRYYAYDTLNRLTDALDQVSGNSAPGGLSERFSYDSFGNLWESGNFTFQPSQYNAANQPSCANFDAAGNVLTDCLGTHYTWDGEGKQISANGASYVYYADGERAGKSGGSATATDYVNFNGEPVARLSGGVWTDLVYGANGLLAEVTGSGGAPNYRFTDQLGSSVGLALSSGGSLSIQDYAPFGELFNGNSDSDPYKFTGKERDAESGNDYFGARYYASSMGRFMSPDDGSDQNALDPASWNLYSYVANNPLNATDPDGHSIQICTTMNGTQHCTDGIDDDAYKAAQQSKSNGGLTGPSLADLQNSATGSGVIKDSSGNVVGTVQWTPDNSGIQGSQAIQAFGQIGNQGMGAIKWFGEQMAWNVAGGFAAHGIGLGVEALQASRAAALARAAEAAADAEKITNGHAFLKHAGEFGNITKNEFKDLVQETISNPSDARSLANGRTAYWNESEQMVVIKNPNAADGGTAFRPTAGKSYFDNLR